MEDDSRAKEDRSDNGYSIVDLVDIARLREIFERFSGTTGCAIGLLSHPAQDVLIAAGWHDFCTQFHKANPESAKCCFNSNAAMSEKLKVVGDMVIETCENGLVVGGIPIIIKEAHVATLMTGQVFFQKPDLERFKRQAVSYGYDTDKYLQALSRIPVVRQEDFKATLAFLGEVALLIAELGYDRLEMKENSARLEEKIAESAKAGSRVIHLNAILRSISRINQLIMTEKDRGAILEGACKIVAECRDYRLVWIGTVADGSYDITPVASGGPETGYVDSIHVTWDESPLGQGPAGRAVKTRGPVIVDDIAADPTFAPWRDEVSRWGYASMISVPIVHLTHVYGVMNVYSDKVGAFNEEEVALLDELAGDIGIALNAIDERSHREQFEEALEHERAILSTTINTLPVLIYFKDTDSRFVIANRATMDAMGVKEMEDLLGKGDKDFYPPEMAQRFLADEQEVIRTGNPLLSREEQIRTASGEMRWLLTTKMPIRDRSGAITGLVGIGRDITERRRAEEAIQREKVFGDTIIDTIPGLFYVVDAQGRYLRWSKTQENIFGLTPQQMWHLDVFSTIHEDDRGRLAQKIAEVFAQGYAEGEGRVLTKDGARWYYFLARKMVVGDEAYIVGSGIDITDRKRAEESIIVSEESYRAIFNTANDAIFVHDIETGQVVDVNDKACEMYVYPKEEMLALSAQDLSLNEPPYTQAEMSEHVDKAAKGEPQLFEWVAKDKAQRYFWVEFNLRRAVIGGKYRILAIARDITERKQSEERWARIHTTFLNFGPDPLENINQLVALCGELLNADCALYNRLEEGFLKTCGQWNCPADFVPVDKAEGHICYDVINQGKDEVVVIRELQNTDYARTDPSVSKYNLQTYVGRVIKVGGVHSGTLCIVYQRDFDPTEEDKEIIGFISLVIAVEEERHSAEEISQIAHFAIEHSADPIFWVGPDAKILYINEIAAKGLGYAREELLDLAIHDIDPAFPKESWASHWHQVKDRRSFTFESKHRRKDGSVFPVEVTVNYMEFQGGEYIFAFARDITERKKQEEALLRRDYQLEILSRTSQHINAVLEVTTVLRTLVAAAIELVDATAGMAGLMRDGNMVFKEYNKDGKPVPIDYVARPGEGLCGCIGKTPKTNICNNAEADDRISPEIKKLFGVRTLVNVPILNREGTVLGCLEIHNKSGGAAFDAQDVFMLQGLAASAAVALENASMLEQRDKAEKALAWQKNYYETLLDEANVWIEAVDKEGRVVLWNKKAEAMTGFKKSEVLGSLKKWSLLYPDQARRNKVVRFIKKITAAGKTIKDIETEITISTLEKRLMSWSSNTVRDSNGKIMGSMLIGNDVTERRRAEKDREVLDKEIVKTNIRLKQLALKDSQTGLYNHNYLGEVIESEFYRAKRFGHPLSLIMVDIDYFKSVNDLYGHEFGDLVLRQFARYLRQMVRKYDVVVRYGGEEFVVLLSGADRARAISFAQRLLEAITLYTFGDKKHVIKLKLSMAVAAYPDDVITKGMDLVDLCDKILNRAKEAGGNAVYSSIDIKKGQRAVLERADIKFLKEKIARLTRRGKQSLIESIFAFAKTIEMRDHYTGRHAESTVHYSTEIAKALKLNREETDHIKQAAVLHDLGKVGISDKILHKKSKLSKKEYEEIKKHPQIAADIIRPIQFMHDIIPLILYHHERWDGRGYPVGLRGEEIPVGARIISIADVYQALTSDRPYRKAFPKKLAMKIIREGAGTQFDPSIVKAFLEILKKENGLPSDRRSHQ